MDGGSRLWSSLCLQAWIFELKAECMWREQEALQRRVFGDWLAKGGALREHGSWPHSSVIRRRRGHLMTWWLETGHGKPQGLPPPTPRAMRVRTPRGSGFRRDRSAQVTSQAGSRGVTAKGILSLPLLGFLLAERTSLSLGYVKQKASGSLVILWVCCLSASLPNGTCLFYAKYNFLCGQAIASWVSWSMWPKVKERKEGKWKSLRYTWIFVILCSIQYMEFSRPKHWSA